MLRLDGALIAHEPEDPTMFYVGIDVASQESAVCILDSKGKIVREAKLSTDPEALGRFLADTGLAIERVGLESGCTAAWLFTGLQERGWASDLHRCPQGSPLENRGFGLVPRKYQSGEIDRTGRITKVDDAMAGTACSRRPT